jgi:hypothetical protein
MSKPAKAKKKKASKKKSLPAPQPNREEILTSFDDSFLPIDWRVDFWNKFTDQQKLEWIRDREKARSDYMYLANECLGYDFQESPHRELFDLYPKFKPGEKIHFYDISPEFKKRLILWSRGTFKTTSVVVLSIMCHINDPDIPQMIISGSKSLAAGIMGEIKAHYEQPKERFQYLFPEYCKNNIGNKSEFTLPCRRNPHQRNPSCMISSSKTAKSGLHPGLLLVDDIVNDQNYTSPVLMEKAMEDYRMFEPLVDPGGYVVVTGTRYVFGDPYEEIQRRAAEEQARKGKTIWLISVRNCWRNGNRENGPFFPQTRTKAGKPVGHTPEYLANTEIEMGEELFSCQYLNCPLARGHVVFTEQLLDQQTFHWLKPPENDPDWKGVCLPQHGLDFIVGDLAYMNKTRRDLSVLNVCRYWNASVWVYHCRFGKWTTSETAEQVFDLVGTYRPRIVWLEGFLGWEAYDTVFRIFAMQMQIPRYPIEWFEMRLDPNAKEERKKSVQGPLNAKRLWLWGGMDGYQELREQMIKFPKSTRRDDFHDNIGHIVQLPIGWQWEQQQAENPIPEMVRKSREDDQTIYRDNGCGSGIVC